MGGFGETLTFFGTARTANTDSKAKDEDDSDRSPGPDKKARFADYSSDDKFSEKVHRPRHKARDISDVKVEGGKAAAPKPIKADYDSDDACIVRYKQMGYTDEYVANKLKEEGRVRYVARTVSSRWQRLKKAFVEKEEELLDDELSDWHLGEDDALEVAVNHIDDKIEKDILKLQSKKWRDVADHFAQLIHRRKYTPKACLERYESLATDHFLVPIELDDDQEGREKLRNDRIDAARQRRFDAAMAEKEAEEEKKRARAAKKQAKIVAVDTRVDKEEIRRKEQEARQKVKDAAEDARRESRSNAKQWLQHNRLEAQWQRDKAKYEVECLNKLLGLKSTARPQFLSEKLVFDSDSEPAMSDRVTDDDEMPDLFDDDDDDAISPASDSDIPLSIVRNNAPAKTKKSRTVTGGMKPSPAKKARMDSNAPGRFAPTALMKTSTKPTTPSPKPPVPKSTVIPIGATAVTPETLANPRSILTRGELEVRIFERKHTGILKATDTENHAQIVARMDAEDNRLNKDRLRDILRSRLLGLDGTKREWVARLQENDAEESAAGGRGVKSTDEGFLRGYE